MKDVIKQWIFVLNLGILRFFTGLEKNSPINNEEIYLNYMLKYIFQILLIKYTLHHFITKCDRNSYKMRRLLKNGSVYSVGKFTA